MDEEPREIHSPILEKESFKQQMNALGKVVEEAKKRIDYAIAHDSDILKAIEVVERFLRKKRRVCYGGQAINALLPVKHKFYDPKYTIPDYDFFSPNSRADSDELMEDLQKEGFTDVNKRVGIHEGTMKVYVNFVPVADCTDIHPTIFKIIQDRAKVVNGILYCDPDYLRMMMYLELSRPRGDVDRWKKVYERLTLLNTFYPIGECDSAVQIDKETSWSDRHVLLDYVAQNKRLLVGPEIIEFFERNKGTTNMETLVQKGGPVLFLSKSAKLDAEDLKNILSPEGKGIKIECVDVKSDSLFPYCILKRKEKRIAILFQEEACHAYTLLRVEKGQEIRLGTPDLLLHLYYSLLLFGKKEKSFFQTSLQCLIEKLHSVEKRSRTHSTEFLPAFGLRCSGHQKGIATLLKEKKERTEEEKKSRIAKGFKGSKRMTRRIRKEL